MKRVVEWWWRGHGLSIIEVGGDLYLLISDDKIIGGFFSIEEALRKFEEIAIRSVRVYKGEQHGHGKV